MRQADWQLSRNGLFWVLLAFASVVALHVDHVPAWVTVVAAVCILWRILEYRGIVPFPPWPLKAVLVAGCVAGLSMSYRSLIALDPMMAMLLAGFGLKLLEMHHKRDAVVLVYLAWFAAAMNCIFTQDIPQFLLVLLVYAIATAALVSINEPKARGFSAAPAARALKIMTTALPFMLVLFLVVPRLGAFWSIPVPKHQARTGVSETMAPGQFSDLVGSDALAFRVRFDGAVPDRGQLYWRGLVLSHFDGRTWRRGGSPANRSVLGHNDSSIERRGQPVSYTVTMEPTYRHWLFALSTPATAEPGVRRMRDSRLASSSRISHRRMYEIQSWLDYSLEADGMHPHSEESERALPSGFNPETVRVAEQWAQETPDAVALIQRLLQLYNQSFVYTLEPPLLGMHSVDEFLWETRRGFCEHFAGSFAFFMRAAGHPARVVGGYLGGEVHPTESFVTVRQYDAHAWAEVWVEGRGWLRVDPTAAVAPERIEMSLADLFRDQDGFLADSPLSLMRFRSFGLVNWFIQQRDYLDYAWGTWVLGYDRQQADVLNRLLGEVNVVRVVLLFAAAAALTMLPYAFSRLVRRRRLRPDTRDELILRFCRKMERSGLPRKTGEGILDYAHRIAAEWPQAGPEALLIARTYAAQRYEELPIPGIDELARMVRRFNPPRRNPAG